jgi:hypothetical protein
LKIVKISLVLPFSKVLTFSALSSFKPVIFISGVVSAFVTPSMWLKSIGGANKSNPFVLCSSMILFSSVSFLSFSASSYLCIAPFTFNAYRASSTP